MLPGGGVEGVTAVGEPSVKDGDGQYGQGEQCDAGGSEEELSPDRDKDGEDKLEQEDGEYGTGYS